MNFILLQRFLEVRKKRGLQVSALPLLWRIALLSIFWGVPESAQALPVSSTHPAPPPHESAGTVENVLDSSFRFVPPADSGMPPRSSGGAVRSSGMFLIQSDRPLQRIGSSATRNQLFVPPPDNPTTQQGNSGATRGNTFTPPPDNPTTQQGNSGASRLGLAATNSGQTAIGLPNFLVPLLPQNDYGTTLVARPTLLVYVPAIAERYALFSLKDEDRHTLYQTVVPLSEQAGVVAVSLPASAPALEVGRNYQWFFVVPLEGELDPNSPYVEGWIRRIAPTPALTTNLAHSDLLERAKVLARSGVWYDSVAILATLRSAAPQDLVLSKYWTDFLESVDLQNIAAASLTANR